jgi:hypothetical protein
MKWVAVALSALVAAIGSIGLLWPAALLEIGRVFGTPSGLYAAAALRIGFGAALFLAAPASRLPALVRAIGIVIFVAGLMTPLIGIERLLAVLDWASALDPFLLRVWAGIALAFGGFLTWALRPRSIAA